MQSLALTIASIFIGGLIAIQGSINANLGSFLRHPLQAAWVNFAGGLFVLSVLVASLRAPIPPSAQLAKIPFIYWCGGLLGATFVTSAIVLIPKIGVSTYIGALIAGQLLFGLLIDHFGFFGIGVRPVSWIKVLGACFLLVGVFCMHRGAR